MMQPHRRYPSLAVAAIFVAWLGGPLGTVSALKLRPRQSGLAIIRATPAGGAPPRAFVSPRAEPSRPNSRRNNFRGASPLAAWNGNDSAPPRVLVTGLGVLNGVGVGVDEFWRQLVQGRNPMGTVQSFDASGMACSIASEVTAAQFDPAAFFREPKDVRRNDRYTHFAVAAGKMAVEDAGLDTSKVNSERLGIVVGSGIGGIGWMEKELRTLIAKGPRRVSPYLIPAMIANTASGVLAIELGARGPNFGMVSACATGTHSIGEALRLLQSGRADVMLAGGAEAAITPLSFAGFNALTAMARGFNDVPKKACRPFDKLRKGFVMGEGAGVLLLETEPHAVRRGASQVYGELCGYAANCDAHHVTAPAPGGRGLAECLRLTLQDAGLPVELVGYVNAHGTSTPYNDKFETQAFKTAFGEQEARKMLISSTKSMTGHCLGATGGIEAVAAAKALQTGIAPPTINYEVPDEECDLNYTPNQAQRIPEGRTAVVSDTLGFGGHNAAIAMRRYEPRQ
eukprot:GHVT01088873.1.p1 GENE.GHVT01088873.1~~GHVT01088873.1.p1  ORF type:complete len:511 (-),score=135.05 GHVT01088873.1:1210-2742(-)